MRTFVSILTTTMVTLIKYVFTVFLCLGVTALFAQKPKTVPVAKSKGFQKFSPPKLTTALGIRTDTAIVQLEEAIQLVKLPLRISDDKKNIYTISSYRAMYKRRAVTEDEQTGKVTPIISNVSDLFKTTPLSPIWIKSLTEQMRSGEEIHFFDIVVKDPQGRLMFAPELRIKIK